MHADSENCLEGWCDAVRAYGQSCPSKRFLRLAHPRRDLRIGLRRFPNPHRRDSFRDRNCRMGPLLRLSLSDRFPRILQLPALGDPARIGGSRNTPGNIERDDTKAEPSCPAHLSTALFLLHVNILRERESANSTPP